VDAVEHVRRYITLTAALGFSVLSGAWYSFALPGNAQEPRVTIEPRNGPSETGKGSADRLGTTIRVNSDLVLIPVMVTDRDDRAVTGLERTHFRLWEDKIEQTITHFASEDVPVSIVVAFDLSGSMGNKFKLSLAALNQFIRSANPEDEFALVVFSDQARLLRKFTQDTEAIQNQMLFVQPNGQTALLDAIVLSLEEMRHARYSRKAILIISDGGDNNSRYTVNEVKQRVRESDVQVHAIGIEESLMLSSRSMEDLGGAALLSDLATQSGGRLYEIFNTSDLPNVAAKIGSALRSQYVLGYVPSAERRDGKYHRVQVKVAQPPGVSRLRASFRNGYIAPGN
jgi:Ca-activated chloride channel homolog